MGGFNNCLTLLQEGPDLFHGVHIWAKQVPVHHLGVVVEAGLCSLGRVHRGVVVRKDVVASVGQKDTTTGSSISLLQR